jgi:polyhydroxyalkanoate synthesis regulator phasin
MLELIRKTLLAGIGAAIVTRDKVMDATHRFVEEGKMSTEEAERMADDLIRSGERQWHELNDWLSEMMKKWGDGTSFVRDREFQELRARVEMLEMRIAELEVVEGIGGKDKGSVID